MRWGSECCDEKSGRYRWEEMIVKSSLMYATGGLIQSDVRKARFQARNVDPYPVAKPYLSRIGAVICQ